MEQNEKNTILRYRARDPLRFDVVHVFVEPYAESAKQAKAWRRAENDDGEPFWCPYAYFRTDELFVSQHEAEEYCRKKVEKKIAEMERRIARLKQRLAEHEFC